MFLEGLAGDLTCMLSGRSRAWSVVQGKDKEAQGTQSTSNSSSMGFCMAATVSKPRLQWDCQQA